MSTPRPILRAGVAKSDITNDREADRVRDPLFAKALVLDDGSTRAAVIAMDTTAIGGRAISLGALNDVGEDFLPRLRERVEAALDIPGAHVLVNASHTHPPGPLLCDDDQQVERVFDAVRRAVENMTEVRVGSGAGYEDRITVNRTLRLKDGSDWTVRHTNPCPPDDEVEAVGPIDPEIGVIRIDRLDGRPLAVAYNFACHPLFGDARGSITANFPGAASRVIEDALGGDAMALFLQGAGGDVIDVGFKDLLRPRDIEPLAALLGASTLKAWRQIEPGRADLRVASEVIELPRRTDIPERIAALQKEQEELLGSLRGTTLNFKTFLPLYLQHALWPDYPSHDAYRYLQEKRIGRGELAAMDEWTRQRVEKYLGGIRAMEKLARIQDKIATLRKHQAINEEAGSPVVAAEVQGVRIGDAVLVTSPAELLVEVGLNIKKASPCRRTFVVPFSNGYLHYGPPADAYDRGGYEVTECLLAPEWQAIYERKALEIIRRVL